MAMRSNQIRSKKESINGRFAKEDSYSNITKQPQQKRIYTWAIHHKMQNKYTYTSLCLPSYPYRNHSSSPHPLFNSLRDPQNRSSLLVGQPMRHHIILRVSSNGHRVVGSQGAHRLQRPHLGLVEPLRLQLLCRVL